jgi:hypothetical protein
MRFRDGSRDHQECLGVARGVIKCESRHESWEKSEQKKKDKKKKKKKKKK